MDAYRNIFTYMYIYIYVCMHVELILSFAPWHPYWSKIVVLT